MLLASLLLRYDHRGDCLSQSRLRGKERAVAFDGLHVGTRCLSYGALASLRGLLSIRCRLLRTAFRRRLGGGIRYQRG